MKKNPSAQQAIKRTLMYRAELNTITADEASELLGFLKRERKPKPQAAALELSRPASV